MEFGIMGRVLVSVATVLALGIVTACSGGAPTAENPRAAKFKAIGKANKAIGEELKKDLGKARRVQGQGRDLRRCHCQAEGRRRDRRRGAGPRRRRRGAPDVQGVSR
jgi:hypothetical protein